MKPGDLVTLNCHDSIKFPGDERGEYYDLLTRDLSALSGGVFCACDVGIILETKVTKNNVHTRYRVWSPQGDGWIVQGLIKRVIRETR